MSTFLTFDNRWWWLARGKHLIRQDDVEWLSYLESRNISTQQSLSELGCKNERLSFKLVHFTYKPIDIPSCLSVDSTYDTENVNATQVNALMSEVFESVKGPPVGVLNLFTESGSEGAALLCWERKQIGPL